MDDQTNKIINAARELLRMYGYHMDHLWHVDDVHFLCEQHGYSKLSDAEAMDVFAVADQQFDGEYGISWPRLEKALVTYLKREELLKKEPEDICESD